MTRPWPWTAAHAKAKAVGSAKDRRKAIHEWAVLSRLALGDSVPVRELLAATRPEVDALMDARVRGASRVEDAITGPP